MYVNLFLLRFNIIYLFLSEIKSRAFNIGERLHLTFFPSFLVRLHSRPTSILFLTISYQQRQCNSLDMRTKNIKICWELGQNVETNHSSKIILN